jgi:membrane-associated protein
MTEARTPATKLGRRHAWLAAVGAVLAVAAALLVLAFLEGDLGEEFGDVEGFVGYVISHYGAPASILLVYVEETGVPLPVPGDVYVAYLGSLARGSQLELVAAWLAIVIAVTAGATNLYLAARKWGHNLVANRYAHLLHLDQGRLDVVEGWFGRWGAVAIIFGRHIPGFRIPITVMAGIFEVRYRVFAPSVALSTGVWAAVWLYLGSRYGPSVVHAFGRHTWLYAVVVAALALVVAIVAVRAYRASR